jgi:hypothetical protein
MNFSRKLTLVLTDYTKKTSLGSKLRAKRIVPLIHMIEEMNRKHGKVKIIDLGGTIDYWNILPKHIFNAKTIEITIVNLPGVNCINNTTVFKFIEADACELPFIEDKSFHIAHSNSVIEHVGDWNRMRKFANEFSRIAEKYYLQTPNFWFPIEPHCMTPFFHWLPLPIKVSLIMKFTLGYWNRQQSVDSAINIVESARLLDRKMLMSLLPDARIIIERFFLLPKSIISTRN